VGGPYAPYRQSERKERYAGAASRVLEAGRAYACFCADELLAAKRKEQLAAGEEPRYDGACRSLHPAEARRRVQAGETHALRFKVGRGTVRFQDRVRGTMRIDTSTFGDFVLLRMSGLPTYNFACVVDDAGMSITCVVRGEDHLYNTARQLLLYEALDLRPPEFAHLSLILDEERGKLSKREGREGTFVDEYRERGYLPEALMNFLALLGWSSPAGDEILAPERLVREFDLGRVSKSPAVFDARKLRWMAGAHLRARPDAELAARAAAFLRAAGLDDDPEHCRRWITAFKDGIAALGELPARVREVLEPVRESDAEAAMAAPGARRLLHALAVKLEKAGAAGTVDGQSFKRLLLDCGKELDLEGQKLFMPVRAALSGRLHGPELPLLFDVLGYEKALQRLHDSVAGTSDSRA
jgi:nondiscriminating glutamyl-tRNA synthetase